MQKHRAGSTVLDAAIEGAKVRFRPILMTSFAFIAGLIPLVLAHGAGAIGNRTIHVHQKEFDLTGTGQHFRRSEVCKLSVRHRESPF